MYCASALSSALSKRPPDCQCHILRVVSCNVRRRHELAWQRENIPGEQVDALAAGTGSGHHLLHLHLRDRHLRVRRARLGHPCRGRSKHLHATMIPAVDIKRQVRGRERRALPYPIPCGSCARPLPETFTHPHASELDPERPADSLLFRSLRSSFARLPSRLSTKFAIILAYSSRCKRDSAAHAERRSLRGAWAIRARERSVAFGDPGGALSVLHGSVSAVGVIFDSEAVHVCCICTEHASGTLVLCLGRELYYLQNQTCEKPNVSWDHFQASPQAPSGWHCGCHWYPLGEW